MVILCQGSTKALAQYICGRCCTAAPTAELLLLLIRPPRPAPNNLDGALQVAGLDGRAIKVPLGPGPVQPGSKITVPGEGMPITKQPGTKGDLVVNIKVQLPRLTAVQKEKVKEACSS